MGISIDELTGLGDFSSGPGWAQIKDIGKPGERRHGLHQYWSALLDAAAATLSEGEDFTVTTKVFLKHESPGWVDGFRVDLG